MLIRTSLYQPTRIRVTLDGDLAYVDMGDGAYQGVTVVFDDHQGLLGFMRALADARCAPGVWQDTGEPDQ